MTVFLALFFLTVGVAIGRRGGRRAASTTPPPFDAALHAAARAYCEARFNYGRAYVDGEAGRDEHIERDVRDTADEPWLRAVVKAALEAEGRP